MNILDILITAAVVAVAVWYLYRTYFVKKGCSCGTDNCCSGGKTENEEHSPDNDLQKK